MQSFEDLEWRECSEEWEAPFYAAGTGSYFDWPPITDVFPWQHSGSQLKRTWPVGETEQVLQKRWQSLMALSKSRRRMAFKETRDRKIDRRYQALRDVGNRDEPISALYPSACVPPIERYAYRSLDRHSVIADSRVGDFMRPDLWRIHGESQCYMTSLLTDVIGTGPAAMVASYIPDLHHFHGRGAKDIIPLWRDGDTSDPIITDGVLESLGQTYGSCIAPERLSCVFLRNISPAVLCDQILGRTGASSTSPANHEGLGTV